MSESNGIQRVAKNTVALYTRMFFQMVVYFYTSRLVLQALGVVDYGIYDLVGGIVGILVFLNNSMTTSSLRFITYAMGQGDRKTINSVFSVSLSVHVALAILIGVVGETIGLWYVKNCLVIPATRLSSAIWAYHCSLFAALIAILNVPYNATIIANERMTAFAGISIIDILLKLFIVLLLPYIDEDSLITYALLILIESLAIRILYATYCHIVFRQIRFHANLLSRRKFREMLSFAGWSMLGNLSIVCNNYGINVILNLFGGPVVNAARGIAFTVQSAILSFISSFQTAVNPQITKYYAQARLEPMNNLVLRSSKFSFFLILFVSLPLMLETETLLSIWLPVVPSHAVIFTRLLVCVAVVEGIANPMMVGASATGHVRRYYITIGTTLLSTLPIAYVVLKLYGVFASVFVVQLAMAIVAQIFRLFLCRDLFCLSIREFLVNVLRPIGIVAIFASVIPVYTHFAVDNNYIRLLMVVVTSIFSIFVAVFFLGLQPMEKQFLISKVCRR